MAALGKNSSEICRDKKARQTYKGTESYVCALRCLGETHFSVKKKNFLPIMPFLPKIRNRCLLSGRSRSVFYRFRVSRIKFRDFVLLGMLPGILKASW